MKYLNTILLWFMSMNFAVCAQPHEWPGPSTNHMTSLNAELWELRAELNFPALAAAVVHKTNIVAAGAVGFRKHGAVQAVTLDDKFHIGSCTKSMTALLAVMLEREQKIDLDATAGAVLKDWKLPKHADEIRLRWLLQNRGGLAQAPPDAVWENAWRLKGSGREQREQFLKEFLKAPPDKAPNTEFLYSNQGFALAGAMLETAAGSDWEDLMRNYLFEPLGMKSAGFGSPVAAGTLDQPWGHTKTWWKVEAAEPSDNPPAIAPAGAVHCSILDLARYAAFQMQAARGEIPELRASTPDLYAPPAGQKYALGWLVVERPWAKGRALTHTGSNTMYCAVIWIAPEIELAIVVATNIGDKGAPGRCDKVVGALLEKHLPKSEEGSRPN